MKSSTPDWLAEGYVTLDTLKSMDLVPPKKRLKAKTYTAMIECIQEIPCNACLYACKFGSVKMKRINDIPKVDFDLCTGCMACIKVCPGLAIFMLTIRDGRGHVALQYEFRPVPKVGDKVILLDRTGKVLGDGKVAWVIPPEKNDGTAIVDIEVPEELIFEVRAFKPRS